MVSRRQEQKLFLVMTLRTTYDLVFYDSTATQFVRVHSVDDEDVKGKQEESYLMRSFGLDRSSAHVSMGLSSEELYGWNSRYQFV